MREKNSRENSMVLKANQVNPRKRTRAEIRQEAIMQKGQPEPYWMQKTFMAQQSLPLVPTGPATFGVSVEDGVISFENKIMTRGVCVEQRPEHEGILDVRSGAERIPQVALGANSPRGTTGKGSPSVRNLTGGTPLVAVPEFDPEGGILNVGATE